MSSFLPDNGIPNNSIFNLKYNDTVYIVQLLSNPSEDVDMFFNPERIYKQAVNENNVINIVRADVDDDLLMELENHVSILNQKLLAIARLLRLDVLTDGSFLPVGFEKYRVTYNDSFICDIQTAYYDETGQYTVKYLEELDLIKSKLYHVIGYDFMTNSHVIDLAYLNIKGSVVL
ncbi:MAG: hypothetical protein RSC93_00960 [Erysipelotrichaceae bacterium]